VELSLTPGTTIRLKMAPEWGLGQVQSCIGYRLTANFENSGKVTIDTRRVEIEVVAPGRF